MIYSLLIKNDRKYIYNNKKKNYISNKQTLYSSNNHKKCITISAFPLKY